MLEVVLQMIKFVAPCIAAALVIRAMNARSEKKYQQIVENEEVNYIISYSPFLYILMYICAFISLGGMIWAYLDGQLDMIMGIILGAFLVLGVAGILGTHVWKIWVNGNQVIYRSYIGIKHFYTFAQFTKMTEKSDGAIVFYVSGKKAFKIDNNLEERKILASQLMEINVPIDVEGMTIENFTVKPAPINWIAAVMCAVACGGASVALFLQYFMIDRLVLCMVACTIISIAVFIDLVTDKMIIEGKQITRKRGFTTKVYQVSEIEKVAFKKGTWRENIEFYVKDKVVMTVWIKNRPMQLLIDKLEESNIPIGGIEDIESESTEEK